MLQISAAYFSCIQQWILLKFVTGIGNMLPLYKNVLRGMKKSEYVSENNETETKTCTRSRLALNVLISSAAVAHVAMDVRVKGLNVVTKNHDKCRKIVLFGSNFVTRTVCFRLSRIQCHRH